MVFRSKVDAYFKMIMFIVIILIGVAAFFPLLLEDNRQVFIFFILSPILFLIGTSYFLWTYLSVKYVLHPDYLLIKGGINKRHIPYKQITKILPTTAILTGHSILSSRDALEIFYGDKSLKSIKVSPEDKKEFISELKKRNSNVQIQWFYPCDLMG